MSKARKIVIAVLCVLIAITLTVAAVLVSNYTINSAPYSVAYATSAKQGYYAEYLGEVTRNIPKTVQDGGLSQGYPVYGTVQSLTSEQKNLVIAEANSLCTRATLNASGSYDKMDKDGYLYLSDGTPVCDANGVPRRLYKHSASAGMYFGDVSDAEKGVIKRITFAPRSYAVSYGLTGLYAPAGEVIKVEIDSEDMEKCGGITIHIGQALYNGQANNIWSAKNVNRMPVILNTFLVDTENCEFDEEKGIYTCYVGSYLGGPIYVRNTSDTVRVTFTGAVNYRHFILGYTTEEEFEKLCASSAPYFDLEVWENGVLHSGPLKPVKDYSYSDLYDAAVLWEKISLVSTQVKKQGIVTVYDPFVAAGAAVAFPGRASTNCPVDWMKSALDASAFENSRAWGVIHEYNHNFQGWGLPDGGEVTNNALSLVSYSQFTAISSSRTLSTSSGEGGLSGWNAYTSSSWALNRVLEKNYDSTNQLSIYATLLHNIGQENFIAAACVSGVDGYYKRLCEVTGLDMTYFFTEMTDRQPSDSAVEEIKAENLPAFIPVASVYQTGRSITDVDGQKKYIKTMQPFRIAKNEEYTVDLRPYTTENGSYKYGSIVLPQGFSYEIKSISQPASGSLTLLDGNVYRYTPASATKSGEIKVTLSITKDDGAFEVDDVELVLEFEQTHELNKSMLERTVYVYDDNSLYASAQEAYEAGYAGYVSMTEEDNVNPTQNGNAEIWVPSPDDKAVMEIRGKIYVTADGDYRIALRGRQSAALYISLDGGGSYVLAAAFADSDDSPTFRSDEGSYKDLTGLRAGDWVYFKAVLKVEKKSGRKSPFIGVGWGAYESTDALVSDGNDDSGSDGQTSSVTIEYADAYRQSYEFSTEKFTSDYLFTPQHSYSLTDGDVSIPDGSLIAADDISVSYKGKWSRELAVSPFGRVYRGKNGSSCSFSFTGTQFAIFAPAGELGKITVYVDGKEASAQTVGEEAAQSGIIFLSSKLSAGEHNVTIVCNSSVTLTSFALWG